MCCNNVIYILASPDRAQCVRDIVVTKYPDAACREITVCELKDEKEIETLAVDWNLYQCIRPLYKSLIINELAFVCHNVYIDDSPEGIEILKSYEEKALKEKKYDICKLVNHIRTEFNLWKRKVVMDAYPNLLQIESTSICNAKCIMCKHLISNNKNAGNMTMDIIHKLDDILPYVGRVILHGFGEPFVNPQIKEIIEYYLSFGIKLVTNTNLSVLPDNILDLLNDAFYQIHVSCDGCTKEIFEGIRRNINFEKFIHNVKKLKSNCPNVRLIMNIVMMRQNLLQLPDMVSFAKELGFEEVVFMPIGVDAYLDNYEDGLVNFPQLTLKTTEQIIKKSEELKIRVTIPELNYKFDEEKYREEVIKIKKMKLFKSDSDIAILIKNAEEQMKTGMVEQERQWNVSTFTCAGICDWVIEKAVIDLHGNVFFCCVNMDYMSENIKISQKIGNICKTEFKVLWNAENYIRIRKAFYDGRVPEICVGCQFLTDKIMNTVEIADVQENFLTRKF